METVPSVAELLKERNELQAKVAALSAAVAHPWPKDPHAMRVWLEIRDAALHSVDSAVREHNDRITKAAIYKIREKFSKLANHIWGQGVKDFTSNTVDALGQWLTGPIFSLGGATSPAWTQLKKATEEVEEIMAAEAKKKK